MSYMLKARWRHTLEATMATVRAKRPDERAGPASLATILQEFVKDTHVFEEAIFGRDITES